MKKYHYILLEGTEWNLDSKVSELQEEGYKQIGLPLLYRHENKVTIVSMLFRKKI